MMQRRGKKRYKEGHLVIYLAVDAKLHDISNYRQIISVWRKKKVLRGYGGYERLVDE
jgi:hypothetical protein